MKRFLIKLMYKDDRLYSLINPIVDFWSSPLGAKVCLWFGCPGIIFYSSYHAEPDERCRRCGEYHDEMTKFDECMMYTLFYIEAAWTLLVCYADIIFRQLRRTH